MVGATRRKLDSKHYLNLRDRFDAMTLEAVHILVSHCAVGAKVMSTLLTVVGCAFTRLASSASRATGSVRILKCRHFNVFIKHSEQRVLITWSHGESESGGDDEVELGEPKSNPLSSIMLGRDRTASSP